ncbi:hypothetical protein PF006_g5173 [Phytophthora fragariae]|uniref:Uncharacterized protein n=1 Tax=Phytophthora fragariae TaxID=53985 RepID=A0A6A3UIF1_9STRA|nr:hypothetical protein PF006_g5173 [Phytophthora fragariae]
MRELSQERGTFGWDLDRDDKHIVGDGSDERPFVIGLTTKALVQRLMVPPESFIMHVDTAYNMNFREYPVLVPALHRLYFWITLRDVMVKYTIADADQAQFNTLSAVLGGAG